MKEQFFLFLFLFSTLIYSLGSMSVYAQSSVSIPNTDEPQIKIPSPITIDPILPYLEGYAYDTKGVIIPNAKVMIKLDMSKSTFYETRADENGFFMVDPKYIPIFPYFLEFSNPLSTAPSLIMTTTDFAKKNKDYLVKNKVNLETATKEGKIILPGSLSTPPSSTSSSSSRINPLNFSKSQLGGANNQPTTISQQAKTQSPPSSLFIILLLFLFILILGGGAVYLFMKMKNRQNGGPISLGVILLFLTIFSFHVEAQIGPPVQQSQSWRCLKLGDHSPNNMDVFGDGFPINTDIYIVECSITEKGKYSCSTGERVYNDLLKIGGRNPGFIHITPDTKLQTTDGNIAAHIVDNANDAQGFASYGFAFFGVSLEEPTPTSPPATPTSPPGGVTGEAKSQQQETFEMVDLGAGPPPPQTLEDLSKCLVIGWDPFGRVFDSRSLEPLPSTVLTIWNKEHKKVSSPFTQNPSLPTLADGLYNFLVEPGTYYLTVKTPERYSFTEKPNLNLFYTSVYKNIYHPGEPIVEEIDTEEERRKGKPDPEHRDIPLDPGINKPYEACPSSIAYGVVSLSGYTKINGKVSHPLTVVSLMQEERELLRKPADKFGFYELLVENSKIAQDIPLSIKLTKVDLTRTGKTFPECDLKIENKVVKLRVD